MRLNRVLLLAATVNILIFALVFISCSGEDGKRGPDGRNCWVSDSDDGWDVFCGEGNRVGGLKNNDSGERGEPGDPGAPGKQGDYCLLGNSTANGYEILCGGESKGFLDGCTATSFPRNEFQSVLACGKNTKPINLCKGKIFDAVKEVCDDVDGTVVNLKEVQATCGPKLTTYNKTTHYCGYASKADYSRGTLSVLPLCGTDLPKPYNNIMIPNSNVSSILYAVKDKTGMDEDGNHLTTTSDGISSFTSPTNLTNEQCAGIGGRNIKTSDGTLWVTANPQVPNAANVAYCVASADVCRQGTNTYWIASTASIGAGGGKWLGGTEGLKIPNSYYPRCVKVSPDWNYDYCSYFTYFASGDSKQKIASIVTNQYCGPADVFGAWSDETRAVAANAMNSGSWKGEYCGFAKADVLTKSVVKGVCDDYGANAKMGPDNGEDPYNIYGPNKGGGKRQLNNLFQSTSGGNPVAQNNILNKDYGPNEIAFGYGYCTITAADYKNYRDNAKTKYSSRLCGTNKNNKPNDGKWKNEYCGLSSDSKGNVTQVVLSDICDNLVGPKSEDNPNFTNGYCEAERPSDAYPTGKTFNSTKRCPVGKAQKLTATNEKTWQGQYCGYANATSNDLKVWDGVCDDGYGPHQEGYGYNYGYCQAMKDEDSGKAKTKLVTRADTCDDGKRYNEGSWKGEYCGVVSKEATETTVQQGGCDLGEGPNSGTFGSGYCRARQPALTGLYAGVSVTEYSIEFCGENGKPNDGSWKGEYCGYTAEGTQTVQTGVCGDGTGPNSTSFGTGYCVGVQGSKKTQYTSELCGEDGKPNEGSWKGEYCFADKKIATCTGGYIANPTKNSTDPLSVRCTFTNSFVCSTTNLAACDKDACGALTGYAWDDANNECKEVKAVPTAKRLAKRK